MAETDGQGNISVAGHGECPSGGSVCKGEIVNISQATGLLAEAIEKAEQSADTEIDTANLYVAVTGSHIRGYKGTGKVIITTPDRKISREHIDEAVRNAMQIEIPPEYIRLNSIHGNYLIDGIRRTSNPEDQIADKLEAFAHIICGNRNCIENIQAPLRELGYEKSNPVFSALAASTGVLTDEELKHGVLLIDMGAGTTEFMLFHDSGVHCCNVLSVGCEHIANDLAIGLELNIAFCRKIITDNMCSSRRAQGQPFIEYEGTIGTRKIPINTVEKVMELRIREAAEYIHKVLASQNLLQLMNRGVVITGGAALIPQTYEIINSVFESVVRIGNPPEMSGAITNLKSPRYSMIAGLLKLGEKNRFAGEKGGRNFLERFDRILWDGTRRLTRQMKNAIKF